MPKLPTPYGERPTPGFGRPLKVGPQVEPVDNGYQQLAAGFKGLADEIEKVQLRNDKYDVDDAITRLKQSILDRKSGENGWVHQKGANVAKNPSFFKDQFDVFGQDKDSIGGDLGSDRAKREYSRQADIAGLAVQNSLLGHVTGEREAYNTITFEAGLITNQEYASQEYMNKPEWERMILDTTDKVIRRSEDIGLDKEATALAVKQETSAILRGVIEESVDNNNSGLGQKWLDENKKRMMDEDVDAVEELLKKGNLSEKSQAYTDDIMGENLTVTEARAKARKDLSGEMEDVTIRRINARYGEKDADEKQGWGDASDEAYTIYNAALDGESSNYDDFDAQLTTQSLTPQQAFDLIPQSVRERMNQKELSAMRRMVEIRSQSQTVHTQYSWWEYLTDLATNDIDAFRNINLREYVDRISTEKLMVLRKAQTSELDVNILVTKQGIVNTTATALHGSRATTKQKAEVNKRLNDEISAETALRQSGSGQFKEMSNEEIQGIADRLVLTFKRKHPWYRPDSTIKAYAAEIEGVPATIVDELVKGIGGRGVEVYEAEIIAQYNKFADVIARSNGDPTEENILKLIRMRYGDGMILPEIPPNERNTAPSTQSRRPTAPIPDPYKPSVPR